MWKYKTHVDITTELQTKLILQFDFLEGSHEKHLEEDHLSPQHPSQSSSIVETAK